MARRQKRAKPALAEPATVKRIKRTKPVVKAVAKSAAAPKTSPKDALPGTSAEFWLDIVSIRPMTNAEVLAEAKSRLKIKGTKEQMKKLAVRWSVFSLKDGKDKLTKEGKGRTATYVRA
jgi:hypothetical protein